MKNFAGDSEKDSFSLFADVGDAIPLSASNRVSGSQAKLNPLGKADPLLFASSLAKV
jgi:hypothetical protein